MIGKRNNKKQQKEEVKATQKRKKVEANTAPENGV